MILATDVYYTDQGAKAVGVAFAHWPDATPQHAYTAYITEVAAYEPGAFYKRELPCLLQLLQQVNLQTMDAIVVDGYAYLNSDYQPGLGAKLWHALHQTIPVIGVAKTHFHHADAVSMAVQRGNSKNPLYVSAAGIDLPTAATHIQQMHGDYRIPTLLKYLDAQTRL